MSYSFENYDAVKEEVLKKLKKNPALWGDRYVPDSIGISKHAFSNHATQAKLREHFEDVINDGMISDSELSDLIKDTGLEEQLIKQGHISSASYGYS